MAYILCYYGCCVILLEIIKCFFVTIWTATAATIICGAHLDLNILIMLSKRKRSSPLPKGSKILTPFGVLFGNPNVHKSHHQSSHSGYGLHTSNFFLMTEWMWYHPTVQVDNIQTKCSSVTDAAFSTDCGLKWTDAIKTSKQMQPTIGRTTNAKTFAWSLKVEGSGCIRTAFRDSHGGCIKDR